MDSRRSHRRVSSILSDRADARGWDRLRDEWNHRVPTTSTVRAADSEDRERAMTIPALVLASASPRRRRLLERMGIEFTVRPTRVPEDLREAEAPRQYVERLAREKAMAEAGERDELLLGSDTVVVLDDEVLGKPRDAAHARELLRRLAGRTHRVLTGVAAIAEGASRVLHVTTRVTMRAYDEAELRAYVATGEPLDKAGAYAIQGEGGRLVARVAGSRTNVIGLPVEETLRLLASLGVRPERA
ncbi:MAG: Maf family protein [Myxococcota bacterium]|nr:Maf family protein [Myxococcota bacterium]